MKEVRADPNAPQPWLIEVMKRASSGSEGEPSDSREFNGALLEAAPRQRDRHGSRALQGQHKLHAVLYDLDRGERPDRNRALGPGGAQLATLVQAAELLLRRSCAARTAYRGGRFRT